MSDHFRFSVDTFEHVLGHISKAAGKLHGLVGDSDHIRELGGDTRPTMDALLSEGVASSRDNSFSIAEKNNGKPASVYIADLVICARELSRTCPSGPFDLEKAIADRMVEKKDYLAQYAKGSR